MEKLNHFNFKDKLNRPYIVSPVEFVMAVRVDLSNLRGNRNFKSFFLHSATETNIY